MVSWRIIRVRRWQKPILCAVVVVIFIFLRSMYNSNLSPKPPLEKHIIKSGLTYSKRQFYLNGQPFRILSGALHYFRVHPDYWADRLKRLKSAGLNTVETYCPWNWHEEVRGVFSFDGILNLRRFLKLAHQAGLYVILRPGPYICSEWEFGGMPSWLLSDPNMKVRSLYFGFMKATETYLHQLVTEIHDFQFTLGGNIIAFQLENEYGSYGDSLDYMAFLRTTLEKSGVRELMFVSDSDQGMEHTKVLPNTLVAVNFNTAQFMNQLAYHVKSIDADMPIFAAEFWTGWFHNWGFPSNASVITLSNLQNTVHKVLSEGYSINFYMMHGGTTFGFMNGGSENDRRVITSYDYFAPLSESGNPTERFHIIRQEIMQILPPEQVASLPEVPMTIPSMDYGDVTFSKFMSLEKMLELVTPITSERTLAMEELPINANGGQSFGYILYRTQVTASRRLLIQGKVADRAQILLNGLPLPGLPNKGVIEMSGATVHSIDLLEAFEKIPAATYTLDILVENVGRVNYVGYQSDQFNQQRRGIIGSVFLDQRLLDAWKIYPLEFKKPFLNSAVASEAWQVYQESEAPRLLQGEIEVRGTPQDTFVNMRMMTKGVVFVNGFNLGRYWNVGPQYSLYLPAPVLHTGRNQILIFEQHEITGPMVRLKSQPDFTFTE